MKLKDKRVLVCDCEKTMPLAEGTLAKACHAAGMEGDLDLQTQLCRAQLENFQRVIQGMEPVLVACTQEAPLFTEVTAEENPEADLSFVNIRERAGWSEAAKDATPKIVALLAEAALEIPPTPGVSFESKGVCLVYGRDEQAIEAAGQLAGRLEVTVLLSEPGEILPPRVMNVPIFKGTITRAEGHLGKFGINVNDYAPVRPSARGSLEFEAPRNNAFSECDLILDLSGRAPLFTGHERRDGYLRPDSGNPAAVQKAIYEIAELVGEFEKPRYIDFNAEICAHGRSRKTGCTRCLDLCPLGAITPDGDTVKIDPHVCGGCGACASVCPTGAASYQLPKPDALLQRLSTLLSAYQKAGGKEPVILFHDARHGEEMVSVMARLGRGLPANVLPFLVNEVTQLGLDSLSAALAYGASQIAILVGPEKTEELTGLAQQIGLAETVMAGLGYGGGRIHLLDQNDPEAIGSLLYGLERQEKRIPSGSFLPMGGKRTRTMLALRHLHDHAPEAVDILPLPQGAPFGAVKIDSEGCTLCLACVSACPTGALLDDPDRPWLGFNEEACVQCGLCRNTCPESVMALEPRINFTGEAKGAVTLNEAEPFHCIRCGKPFGVASSIERIAERLSGHAMFQDEKQIERIKMCEDCRVVVQFEEPETPFKAGDRPIPRTTDDYLREREIEEARAKVIAEREKEEEK